MRIYEAHANVSGFRAGEHYEADPSDERVIALVESGFLVAVSTADADGDVSPLPLPTDGEADETETAPVDDKPKGRGARTGVPSTPAD